MRGWVETVLYGLALVLSWAVGAAMMAKVYRRLRAWWQRRTARRRQHAEARPRRDTPDGLPALQHALLELSDQGVAVDHGMLLGEAGGTRIIWSDGGIERLLGRPRGSLDGERWMDIIHPEDWGRMQDEAAAGARAGMYRYQHAHGHWVALAWAWDDQSVKGFSICRWRDAMSEHMAREAREVLAQTVEMVADLEAEVEARGGR